MEMSRKCKVTCRLDKRRPINLFGMPHTSGSSTTAAICQICELSDAVDDPNVIDNEQWVQCKECEAFYHDMCGFALKRCKCGHLMKRPEGAKTKSPQLVWSLLCKGCHIM
jgi:hypothetical protein